MIDSSWYSRPANVRSRTSAGGVICRSDKGQLFVALTTEAGMGAYILPKGGVKRGETLEQAAAREIEEEAGFTDLELIALLGVRERLNYDRTRWITTHYFLYRTKQAHSTPSDSGHQYVVHWFALDALPPMVWPEQRELIVVNRDRIEELLCCRQ